MGLFKKSQPIENWEKDLKDLVSSDPDQFIEMSKYDDKSCIVKMRGDYEVWVTYSGKDLYFIVGLSNIGRMAESFGISVEEAYREMTDNVKSCSLGIDGKDNLKFSTVLFGRKYSPEALRNIMYRWVFQIVDYNNAVGTMIEKYKGDEMP